MPRRKLLEGAELPDNTEELQRLREELKATKSELSIAKEEMASAPNSNLAALNTRLRTWPGIDWTKPAYAAKITLRGDDGAETPAEGKVGAFRFSRGWTVTNDLEGIRAEIRRQMCYYSIKEITRGK